MNVYQVDGDGFYVETIVADVDPLDNSNYLIPALCVASPPPSFGEGQRAKWENNAWTIVDAEQSVVEEVQEVRTFTDAELARLKRDSLLLETDYWGLSDHIMTDEQRQYRQLLRDIPQQEGFPSVIDWPVKP